MNVVDILISIVVVTILVTVILAIVTYVAYKMRLAREPARAEEDPGALRYFVDYPPPSVQDSADGEPTSSAADGSSLDRLDRDVAELEGHAAKT